MDTLDEEGLTAATAAYVRLNSAKTEDGAPTDEAQAAKNSRKTAA